MCGRYTASWENASFEKVFNTQSPLFESWNIAPTQYAPIVWQPAGSRETLNARWGLIPKWVKEPFDFSANLFNARAESVSEKVSFKRPFESQRCLVPAGGFYEWKKPSKQPYFIHHESGEPLALAGLYDHWQQGDKEIYSYSILTTTPNDVMEDLHDRMPVILSPEDFDLWLTTGVDTEELEALLKPYEGKLEAHMVSRRVGKPSENDEALIRPVGEEKEIARGHLEGVKSKTKKELAEED
jgi:putative SOS response-associated peptidase YedK